MGCDGVRGGDADQFFEGGLQHEGAGGLEHDHLLRRDGFPETDIQTDTDRPHGQLRHWQVG